MPLRPIGRLRDLFESMTGLRATDSHEVRMAAKALGIDVHDSAAIDELERRWLAMKAEVEASPSSKDPFFIVDPVFQRVIQDEPKIFDSDVLATHPAPIRMLISTRAIDAQVDNGGWPAVFYNAAEDLLPPAIEGYRLLGLDLHAALATRILEHGWTDPTDDTPDDPAWQAFDAEWSALEDVEAARARFIRAHAADFGLGSQATDR